MSSITVTLLLATVIPHASSPGITAEFSSILAFAQQVPPAVPVRPAGAGTRGSANSDPVKVGSQEGKPRPQGASEPSTPGPDAAPVVGTVSAKFPDDQRLALVRRLLRAGRNEEAAMIAQTVLNEHPEIDRAKFFLGLAVHKQKHYGQARPMLEQAAASSQDYPERLHASHFLGWCCYYLGDNEGAKHFFELHASHWPNFDDTHYGLGVIALDEDRVVDAEAAFSTALRLQQLNPADRRSQAKTMARLGDVALRQEQFDEALARYEKAVEMWPDHYEAWARLVRLYNRAGREDDARRAEESEAQARVRMGRQESDEAAPPGIHEPASSPTAPAPPPAGSPAGGGDRQPE